MIVAVVVVESAESAVVVVAVALAVVVNLLIVVRVEWAGTARSIRLLKFYSSSVGTSRSIRSRSITIVTTTNITLH